jgi:CDP-diacylglycerol--glycerol-3-phosphate 3-phosphatidyltransferase
MAESYLGARRTAVFGPSALLTPANGVTIARLAAAPALLGVILAQGPSWLAAAIWGAVATTDGVDGWIARRHGITRSGAFLDPLADKFLLLGALLALAVGGWVWWLPVLLIACREVGMSIYRAGAGRRGVSLPARLPAKLKTIVQDLAVALALVPELAQGAASSAVLWLAVAMTLATGLQYVLDARRGWAPAPEPGLAGSTRAA